MENKIITVSNLDQKGFSQFFKILYYTQSLCIFPLNIFIDFECEKKKWCNVKELENMDVRHALKIWVK